ncbi:MAG: DUF2059 domain-containing protein [Aquabacterium sp.]|jgi:hypothetical protein|nr:MAG: DUF2059 domain-containing protein [Aquabacterium sp.]TAL23900.1 MAG: DUF2059 domain-containing protein [Aquabacterium sp.]
MKRIAALVLTACAVTLSHAAPATNASIEELLVVTKAEKLLDGMYANLDKGVRQTVASTYEGQQLNAEQRRIVDALPGRMLATMKQEIAWSKLKPFYIEVYKENFSQEEIVAQIAFYKTPAGQSVIAKMPAVMQKTMGGVQSRMAPVMAKLQEVMQKSSEEIKAAGAKSAPAKAAK